MSLFPFPDSTCYYCVTNYHAFAIVVVVKNKKRINELFNPLYFTLEGLDLSADGLELILSSSFAVVAFIAK